MPTTTTRLTSGAALLIAAVALSPACTSEPAGEPAVLPEPALLEGPFVPIYRETPSSVLETRQAALTTGAGAGAPAVSQDFYIALDKKELGSKWFLSAYLSQSAPSGVSSGAARSLGTRVVSFKIQNGKLFMFDVADDKEWSDTFRPEVVLEAYPLIESHRPFDGLRGAGDYVLFDPAAGLNRFRLLQDTWVPIEVALSFSQRFRKVPDGATFEQVFSGVLRTFNVNTAGSAVVGPPNVTGTLSLALRRYRESDEYRPTAMPAAEHFFRSPSRLVPNEGVRRFTAAKWALKAGAPIVWKIAPLAAELQNSPAYAGIDLVGAIKRGIESWNVAFGFRAIEAKVADAGDSFGHDDVNYFILDSHRTYGSAFANWRSNPNTGEIRGASVYFPLTFFQPLLPPPLPPPPVGLGGEASDPIEIADGQATTPAPRRVGWGGVDEESLCDRVLPGLEQIAAAAPAGLPPLTASQKVERLLAHIAAHEVGHTLGLRHNFKGSLRPPSSSVMEYVVDDDAMVMNDSLGSYDIAAIRYLYGLAPALPIEPFCNDDQADTVDADCRRFDVGASPLTDDFIPRYQTRLTPFLAGTTSSFLTASVLVGHLRLADSLGRRQAYEGAMAPLRAPVPPVPALPSFASRVDVATRVNLQALFIAPTPGTVVPAGTTPPVPAPPTGTVLAAAATDLGAFIVNQDALRTAPTRRLAVDILKRFQSPVAFAALTTARAQLAATLPTLTGVAAIETTDLLSRIDRTLGSYFD